MRTPLTWNYFTRSTPIKISVYVKETAQSLKSLSAARVMSFEILFVQCAWLKITHRPGTNCARYGITYYGWLFLLPRARAHMPITATQQVTNYILILMRCCREDVKYDCASRELLYTIWGCCVSPRAFLRLISHFLCSARHAAVIRGVSLCVLIRFCSGHRACTERGTSLCHFLQRLRCNYIISKLTLCAGIRPAKLTSCLYTQANCMLCHLIALASLTQSCSSRNDCINHLS